MFRDYLEDLAFVGSAVTGQEALDDLYGLADGLHGPRLRHLDGVEERTAADADVRPAAADFVEQCRVRRDEHRVG